MSDDLDLDQLIEKSGNFFGHAVPRDSATATQVSWYPDWLNLSDRIGEKRAELLQAHGADPTDQEQSLMIRCQIEQALEDPDDDVTPGIWFCPRKGELVVVVCWGGGWDCSRKLFGVFKNREDATAALREKFILSVEEL
jgi:hypothetical protein